MSVPLRQAQNIIALVWDFDKTLIPGYMQDPLFKRFGVDQDHFWREVNGLHQYYAERHGIARINRDVAYLNHILTYVRAGIFRGLNNAMFRALGAELVFYPGLPDFFVALRDRVEQDPRYIPYGIRLEHYIVSSGLAEMIRGSAIFPYVDGVWACELIENPAPPGYHEGAEPAITGVVTQIGYTLDDTSKTRALYEINKGSNKDRSLDVNAKLAQDRRRVPFANMIYIADGQSDIPSFAVASGGGGKTYAVYNPAEPRAQRVAEQLYRERRVDLYGEAVYTPGHQTHDWLLTMTVQIAEGIARRRREAEFAGAQQRLDFGAPPPVPETPPRRVRRRR